MFRFKIPMPNINPVWNRLLYLNRRILAMQSNLNFPTEEDHAHVTEQLWAIQEEIVEKPELTEQNYINYESIHESLQNKLMAFKRSVEDLINLLEENLLLIEQILVVALEAERLSTRSTVPFHVREKILETFDCFTIMRESCVDSIENFEGIISSIFVTVRDEGKLDPIYEEDEDENQAQQQLTDHGVCEETRPFPNIWG